MIASASSPSGSDRNDGGPAPPGAVAPPASHAESTTAASTIAGRNDACATNALAAGSMAACQALGRGGSLSEVAVSGARPAGAAGTPPQHSPAGSTAPSASQASGPRNAPGSIRLPAA